MTRYLKPAALTGLILGALAMAAPSAAATLNTASYGVSYFVDSGTREQSDILVEVNGVSARVEDEFRTPVTFAEGEADIATGALRAQSLRGSASFRLKDTIFVDATGLTFNDIFNLTFTARLTGLLDGNSAAQFFLRADNRLTLGGRDVSFSGGWSGGPENTGNPVSYLDPSVTFGERPGAGFFNPSTGVVSVSMNLRGGKTYATKLDAALTIQGTVDFSSTALLGIETTVPWSSASQVFLTQSATNAPAVPLPAGMWLLLGGLGALGVMRRRAAA